MEFLTVVVSVRNKCQRPSCVACEICIWLCEKFGDFGKREREPGESLARERDCCGDFGQREPGESLESLVILAERERVPGESLESIEMN